MVRPAHKVDGSQSAPRLVLGAFWFTGCGQSSMGVTSYRVMVDGIPDVSAPCG